MTPEVALVITAIFLILTVFSGAMIAGMFLVPLFARGAPFEATSKHRVIHLVELARVRPDEIAYDLGAGDGRIVVALARAGALARGFELHPLLVWIGKLRIAVAGLGMRAAVERKNFWKENFQAADIVTIYGLPSIMEALEHKLRLELKPGARVISVAFPFPTWQPSKIHEKVFLYIQS